MIGISGYSGEDFEPGCEDMDNYITVFSCGYQKYITKDLNSLIRKKGRLDYQLIYISEGKGKFCFNDQMCEIGKGYAVLYRPHEFQYYAYSNKDSTKVYWVHFSGYAAESQLAALGFTGDHVFEAGMDNRYHELFSRIVMELQLKRLNFASLAGLYFLELITIMSRNSEELKHRINSLDKSFLFDIVELMHKQYNKSISMKEYARKVDLSESWFIKRFKGLMGVTPQEYISQIRINKAKELLCNSSLSINEIAGIVGYENPLYFSRVFHNANGISPSSYRKGR